MGLVRESIEKTTRAELVPAILITGLRWHYLLDTLENMYMRL